MEIVLFKTLILDYARIDGAFSQFEYFGFAQYKLKSRTL